MDYTQLPIIKSIISEHWLGDNACKYWQRLSVFAEHFPGNARIEQVGLNYRLQGDGWQLTKDGALTIFGEDTTTIELIKPTIVKVVKTMEVEVYGDISSIEEKHWTIIQEEISYEI